jgi:putative ABC transport system permease protein
MSTGWARDAARTAPGGTLVQTYQYNADTSFVQDMGLKLEASLPNWTVTYSREEGVLINETAARSYGYEPATDALGETLYVGSSGEGEEVTSYTIAGIIDDFVFTGVAQVYTGQGQSRQASPPVYLRADTSGYSEAIVLSRTADLAALRDRIETTWTQELQTVYPFESQFYSELTQERNGPMQDLASIAGFTASLAVLITLLGLLSIAAHTVETRRQEIGIRKALSATISGLVVLLSRDFLWLVGAAVVVSLPVAWWLNAAWLQFLPDSVSIGLGPMALTVVALLALAVLIVASQAFRSARLNPAYTLRDE